MFVCTLHVFAELHSQGTTDSLMPPKNPYLKSINQKKYLPMADSCLRDFPTKSGGWGASKRGGLLFTRNMFTKDILIKARFQSKKIERKQYN